MSGARAIDLLYGHLGDVIYDDETHKWHSTRTPHICRQLNPLEKPSVAVQPSITLNPSGRIQSNLERSQNIKRLAKSFPEFVPALSLLPGLAQQSEIDDQLASARDPFKSSLLAFGTALDKTIGSSRTRCVPIAALASGAAGEHLRLVLLTEEKLGLADDREVKLRRLTAADGEQGWWFGNGSPIQQLCFAKAKDGKSPWLAVRYHGATSILRPLLKSDPISTRSSPLSLSQDPLSRLDANHVTTLSIHQTGGSQHADVSFNTSDRTQFAIVDQQGFWTIWKLEKQVHREDLWMTKAGLSGYVSQGREDDQDTAARNVDNVDTHSKRGNEDGWGAILWAGDGNTVVVANRRTLSIFHIAENVKRLVAPDLSLSKSTDWILDVKSSPSDTHVFVTTSTRIFWLRVLQVNNEENNTDPEAGISILLSWMHFRDPADTSLRMSILDDEGSTVLVLYSRFTALITVFTFQISNNPPGSPFSVSDPFVLAISNDIQAKNALIHSNPTFAKERMISTLELTEAEYEVLDESLPLGVGNQYREGQFRFYQLSVLYNDLSLSECLCIGQSTRNSLQLHLPRPQKYPGIRKALTREVEQGFIVPNRARLADWKKSSPRQVSSKQVKDMARGNGLRPEEDPWTLDFELLERKVQELSSVSMTGQRSIYSTSKRFDLCRELIRSSILHKVNNDSAPGRETLHEMLKTNLFVEDVDTVSEALHCFVASIKRLHPDGEEDAEETLYGNSRVSDLTTPEVFTALSAQPRNGQHLALSHVYDGLIKHWMSTLSENLPGRVRVAIEKRLRENATQLYLASFGVGSNSKHAETEIESYGETVLKTELPLNLASRRSSSPTVPNKPPQSHFKRSASELASSQISEDVGFMPPSPPLPPILAHDRRPSLRSRSSASLKAAGSEDPASGRLRALATLNPQPSLTISASNILRHWTEGSNPDNYDWLAVQSAIAAEKAEPEKDEEELKKVERKERLKRENRDNAAAGPSSQPLPTRVRETQSSPVRATQRTNSQAETIGVPSSQLTRGVYRGPVKKKKAAGFR